MTVRSIACLGQHPAALGLTSSCIDFMSTCLLKRQHQTVRPAHPTASRFELRRHLQQNGQHLT